MAAVRTSNPFEVFYQLGLVSLGNGTFSKFEADTTSQGSSIHKRIIKHLKIKDLMARGEYPKAMILLRDLRNSDGDHISLLCDQASIAYLMKNYSAWIMLTEEIDQTLRRVAEKISPESLTKTLLIMAKFYEEQGLIRKSYDYLKRAEKSASDLMRTRVRANLVRLLSLHLISTELSAYYHELKQISQSEPEFNTYAEFTHALILAETRILGPTAAIEGLAVLRNETKLNFEDMSLIVFDVVQVLLNSGSVIPVSILEEFKDQRAETPYEEKLCNLVLKNVGCTSLWTVWSAQMPLGNYFMLCNTLSKSLPTEQKEIFGRQLKLLIKSLPLPEQRYWQDLIKVNAQGEFYIEIDDKQRTIKINDINISFKSKRALFEMAQFVFQKKKSPLVDYVAAVFETKYNESYYHRIRRLVKRVNDEFSSKLLPAPLQCDRHEIFLTQDYQ